MWLHLKPAAFVKAVLSGYVRGTLVKGAVLAGSLSKGGGAIR